MVTQGFCQKDNKEVDADKGCCHPKDYCPYRQACMIHYMEQERKRTEKKKHQNVENNIEDNEGRDG